MPIGAYAAVNALVRAEVARCCPDAAPQRGDQARDPQDEPAEVPVEPGSAVVE
ncbi:hypothetical protein OHA27_30690 [Streptomyces sp. NBC_01619]|uniref:hypothetical protein n=1 Tax=Streptomyces sp. NBC_01619 TaxID=2975901 RepID=UPI0022591829|nr:hypothetical protein [Streptomyces sp. NBC_01619]MCX4514615.1 hypothetical protein [Streptomyces sp. NBC_01619]